MTLEQRRALERYHAWLMLYRTTIIGDLATLGVLPEVVDSVSTTLASVGGLVVLLLDISQIELPSTTLAA